MTRTIRRLLGAAALTGTFALPAAHAVVVDFEPAALTGLYFSGDSFSQSGFTFTTLIDFGIVDSAVSLGPQAPTGNSTQFYFNANDARLSVASTDALPFDFSGFSAAFVALEPASTQTTVIVAVGTRADSSTVSNFWNFATSATSRFPFTTYGGAAAFAGFSNLTKLDFYACSQVGQAICTEPTFNNGQFAIDDIVLSPVPEPAAAVLLTLGLLGLGWRARRSAAS